jgi:hypothetical protein
MAVVLGYLQNARIAPVDLMLHVLDPRLPEHDRYRVGLYKENGKLLGLMDLIMSDPRGEERLGKWMQPYAVNATCTIVDWEMELVKERLTVPRRCR